MVQVLTLQLKMALQVKFNNDSVVRALRRSPVGDVAGDKCEFDGCRIGLLLSDNVFADKSTV